MVWEVVFGIVDNMGRVCLIEELVDSCQGGKWEA